MKLFMKIMVHEGGSDSIEFSAYVIGTFKCHLTLTSVSVDIIGESSMPLLNRLRTLILGVVSVCHSFAIKETLAEFLPKSTPVPQRKSNQVGRIIEPRAKESIYGR